MHMIISEGFRISFGFVLINSMYCNANLEAMDSMNSAQQYALTVSLIRSIIYFFFKYELKSPNLL